MPMRFVRNTVVLLAAIPALAGSCRAADILYLLKEADAVVIATPTAVDDGPDATTVTLAVTSWLSGGAGESATVLWDEAPLRMRQVSRLAGRLVAGFWFLKRLPDGRYGPIALGNMGFHDLYYAAPPAGNRAAAFRYGADTPLAERIALDLAAAAALETSQDHPGPMVWATAKLGRVPRVHDACAYLAQMPGSRQKAIGLACLIAAGDPAGIAGIEKNLPGMDERDLTAIVVGVLLFWRGSDSASVASLGRIATARSTPYRTAWGAGKALGYIQSADALPYLAELLDHGDIEIRIDAVFGLSMFAHSKPIPDGAGSDYPECWNPRPTRWSILFNEGGTGLDECVSFWKDWWRTNQKMIRSGAY
jgi:hypothetical protein